MSRQYQRPPPTGHLAFPPSASSLLDLMHAHDDAADAADAAGDDDDDDGEAPVSCKANETTWGRSSVYIGSPPPAGA